MSNWKQLNIEFDANLANAVSQINNIVGKASTALDAASAVISIAEGFIVTNLDPLEACGKNCVAKSTNRHQ